MQQQTAFLDMPDTLGYFGEYGGQLIPPELKAVMDDINDAYEEVRQTPAFQDELTDLYAHYVGRPSPIFYAKRLSERQGGARIVLKREDLNHTGAHKINHCLGEALLAKHMGKTKVLAETGAGQHGVALASACALVGIDCEIHMGEVDIAKEHPNVVKMKILGCTLVPVTRGTRTLKDAVDSAFEEYMKDVGGGSNAIGIFTAFLDDAGVELVGAEPGGRGLDTPDHAATMSRGTKGAIHGFACYTLQDAQGEPLPVYSIASGLDYPGVGPQHCYLKDVGRVRYEAITDDECLDAFMVLSRTEGIIPALESAHAVAYAMKAAKTMSPEQTILVNLSGRGDKDADFVANHLGL